MTLGRSIAVTAVFVICLVKPLHAEVFPWTSYFGTHYESAEWSRSIRDPGGPGLAGVRVLSGQAYQGGDENNRLDRLISLLTGPFDDDDVVLGVGGLGSGRSSDHLNDFLNSVENDKAAQWKSSLYARALRIARLPNTKRRVHWQFGNEINGPRFQKNLRSWSSKRKEQFSRSGVSIISLYVEYFLAPGVQAIEKASRDAYGVEGQIKIMLGSVAVGRRQRSREWLEHLLNYRIIGTYAKELAGRKVFEVVDAISIHYTLTGPDNLGLRALDDIHNRWMGRGRVRSIWSTEELGRRRASAGSGAASSLQVTARYLYWWNHRSLTPAQGRCFFWGSRMGSEGTRGDDAMRTLYDFVGNSGLSNLNEATNIVSEKPLEIYTFRSVAENKWVSFVFSSSRSESASFRQISLKGLSGKSIKSAIAHVFSPVGHSVVFARIKMLGSEARIELPRTLEVRADSAIMLFLK